jgi:hypothetical protein
MEQGGMGVGIGDYDVDGLDLFQTHFMGDTCGIYRNDGKGNFEDRTRAAKIGVETRFVSWGTGGVDLDNDGYPDIFLLREVFSQRWSANCRTIPTKRRALFFGTWETELLKNSPPINWSPYNRERAW